METATNSSGNSGNDGDSDNEGSGSSSSRSDNKSGSCTRSRSVDSITQHDMVFTSDGSKPGSSPTSSATTITAIDMTTEDTAMAKGTSPTSLMRREEHKQFRDLFLDTFTEAFGDELQASRLATAPKFMHSQRRKLVMDVANVCTTMCRLFGKQMAANMKYTQIWCCMPLESLRIA